MLFLAYIFLEWNGEEGHSVVEGKVVELKRDSPGFNSGAKVLCKLKEVFFAATVIATG